MSKMTALAWLAAAPSLLGGCITTALWEPYSGAPETKVNTLEAEISAVSWTGARPRDQHKPLCMLFLKGLRPGPENEGAGFPECLSSEPLVLVLETHKADPVDMDYGPDWFASAGAELPIRRISSRLRIFGDFRDGRILCGGEVVLSVPGHEATFAPGTIRIAAGEEIEEAVPIECADSGAGVVRLTEVRSGPRPQAPWYVIGLTPFALAGDIAIVGTVAAVAAAIVVAPYAIALLEPPQHK